MSDGMTDWSDIKSSWKISTASSLDAEKIRALKGRIEKDVRRMRVVSLLELLATVIIAAYLAWQGLSRSSAVETSILLLISLATLAVEGAIMLMRRRLSLTSAETARTLWTLKASRARLAYRLALLGLVAGPAGVLTGYLLATNLGVSTMGEAPILSVPIAIGCAVLFGGGMIYCAFEARRAKRDLIEAQATLAWLDAEEA